MTIQAAVFPGFPGRVLAHWYSGRIQAVDAKTGLSIWWQI